MTAPAESDLTTDVHLELSLVSECVRRYDRFAARGLTPSDFSVVLHQEVIKASQRLWEAGKAVGVETVALELQRAGVVPPEGALRRVADLASTTPLMPDGDRLKALTRLRRVVAAGKDGVAAGMSGNLAGALEAFHAVDQLGQDPRTTRTFAEVSRDLVDQFENPSPERDKARIRLGLDRLDYAIGHLPAGSLLVVAADTNCNKSTYVLEMLLASAQQGTTVGLISMEDGEEVTGARVIGMCTGFSSREIQRGAFSEREAQLARIRGGLAHHDKTLSRFLFADLIGENELEVCAKMTQMAARGAQLIAVDYLQEIHASRAQQDRRNEVRVVASRLKAHARRLGVALVLVSQIARPKEGETNKRPTKHALKESGDTANMAEVILVLWREKEDDFAPVHVAVAKSKWGGVGKQWSMTRSTQTGRLVEGP